MNLRNLETFLIVAKAGGFAATAGKLHLSQPAATRQIQALETELGVLLFDRIGRRLQLTTDGEEIYRRARRLLHEADSLRDRAKALKSGQTGTLRVGASPQNIETVVAPFVGQFRRRHPGIDVHFVEDGGVRVSERLAHGDVQLALTTSGDDQFYGRLLYPTYALAVMPSGHALARRKRIDVSQLAEEPLLILQRSFASRGWFDSACRDADLTPRIVLESAAPATLMALATGGDGIAIVPSNVLIPRQKIRAMPITQRGMPIGRWVFIAWDRRRFLPPFARFFIDELAAQLRQNYPNRQLLKRVPILPRPELSETD